MTKQTQTEMAQTDEMAQTVQTFAPPEGYMAVRDIGKDEVRELMKRAGVEVEYFDKSKKPAHTLTLSSELKRFVCAVLCKYPSRRASFIIGNEGAVVASAENIESDYLAFSVVFEKAAEYATLCKVTTKHFIRRSDGSTYRRFYVRLADGAPLYAKEVKED
jgi:hypothetical protein